MKILAIETSGKVNSIALVENEEVLAHFFLNHQMTHSEVLMPMIRNLLDTVNIELDKIDVFAVSVGPGSFTGIRIGVTTMKAFAYALNKPIVSVNTLEALSYHIPPEKHKVCPIIDARNDQVYTGVFRPNHGRYCLDGDFFSTDIGNFLNRLKDQNEVTFFTGDGAIIHRQKIVDCLGEFGWVAPKTNTLPSAVNVAFVAKQFFDEGKYEDGFSITPFYLKKSGAQIIHERKKRL